MKLSSILAAASLLAAPSLAAAQAHGGIAMGGAAISGAAGAHAGANFGGHWGAGGVAGAHPGAPHAGLGGGRFDHHPGFHDHFHHRDFVALYPYWGWSDCAFDVDCGWHGDDPAGPTPADYVDPPGPPAGYAAAAPRRAEVNECSDWVWRARLHRSVCKQPFRG